MKQEITAERRKILAEAVRDTKRAMGIDVDALDEVRKRFNAQYDDLLPEIAKQQAEVADKNAKEHRRLLESRYTAAKKSGVGNHFTQVLPNCWCQFIKDFLTIGVCDHSIPISDVDVAGNVQADFDCDTSNNIAKPYVMLRGGGDGINNRVTLVSRMGFNLNDSNFPGDDTYCISPTVLLSGYWLKENWAGCDGVTSSGDIRLNLKIKVTQLGGTKVLGESETTVFDWTSGLGFTGTIDKKYNLSGASTSEKFTLYAKVDPADGDVFVEVALTIAQDMNGLGRFLVDFKNSSAFYFWTERVELSRRICWPTICHVGGPDSPELCTPGGPHNVFQCKPGGPNLIFECIPGGPATPELCKFGPGLAGCPGGPALGCLAGPPLDVIVDPVLWEKGTVAIELEKVPNGLRRSLSKMFERILQAG